MRPRKVGLKLQNRPPSTVVRVGLPSLSAVGAVLHPCLLQSGEDGDRGGVFLMQLMGMKVEYYWSGWRWFLWWRWRSLPACCTPWSSGFLSFSSLHSGYQTTTSIIAIILNIIMITTSIIVIVHGIILISDDPRCLLGCLSCWCWQSSPSFTLTNNHSKRPRWDLNIRDFSKLLLSSFLVSCFLV